MMPPRLLAKLRGDLRRHALQLLVVAGAVLIGSFSMSATLGTQSVLNREIAASFESSLPPDIVFSIEPADGQPDSLDRAAALLRAAPGVAAVERRRQVATRAEVAPGDWRPVQLWGIGDFDHLALSAFRPERGAWPPPPGTLLVERSSLPVARAGLGDALHLRLARLGDRSVPISGTAIDPGQAPGWQDNVVYAYADLATLAQLAPGTGGMRLLVGLDPAQRGAARATAAALSDSLTAAGFTVSRVTVPRRQHPHADQMRTIVLMLTALAATAVLLTGLLTATLFAGLLRRHVQQIGLMKALGASTGRIASAYLLFGLTPIVAGTGLGLVLGLPAARLLTLYLAARLNIDPVSLAVPGGVTAGAAGFSLITGFVAVLSPVIHAARLSPRLAMAAMGPALPAGRTPRIGWSADRRVALALRNLFRRKLRLGVTLVALALGGSILMTSMNVYVSLMATLDQIQAGRADDLAASLSHPVPAAELAALAAGPGLARVEARGSVSFGIPVPGGAIAAGRYPLVAPPRDSKAIRPRLDTGRMPAALDEIAVSGSLQAQEPSLVPGARVEILAGGQHRAVLVTGLVEEIAPLAYAAPETTDAILGRPGLAAALWATAEPGALDQAVAALQDRADRAGLDLSITTMAGLRQILAEHFQPMLILLLAVAGGTIAIGALSLAAGLTLTVLERSREIAVMRAIGATPLAVRGILLLEAGAVGLSSALVAIVASLGFSAGIDRLIAQVGLHAEVPFTLSLTALAAWLGFSVTVALLTALIAARTAIRLPIRAVLAYE